MELNFYFTETADVEEIMITLQEIKAAIAAEGQQVTTRLNELAAEIQGLKDQLASGTVVTEADMQDLLDSVNAIFTPST